MSANSNASAGTKSLASAERSGAAMISALEKKTTATVIDLEKREDIGQLLLSALHGEVT